MFRKLDSAVLTYLPLPLPLLLPLSRAGNCYIADPIGDK